jgi:hypothetical protein
VTPPETGSVGEYPDMIIRLIRIAMQEIRGNRNGGNKWAVVACVAAVLVGLIILGILFPDAAHATLNALRMMRRMN